MSFSTRARGQTVLHVDVNQYANYFGGTKHEAVTRFADDATSYADTVGNLDTTNGRALRVQYGTVLSPTVVLEANKLVTWAANFATKGPAIYDPRAYGGVGTGDGDQTAYVAAARTALIANASRAGTLFFPPGHWRINDTLVLQDLYGVQLAGSGENCSILHIYPREDDWADKHIVDFSGSFNVQVKNLDIRNDQSGSGSGANMPATGIFLGQNATHSPAVSGSNWGSTWDANSANAFHFESVRVEGPFEFACVYIYGVPSSTMVNVDLYLRSDAAISNNSANAACLIMTRDNPLGLVAANGYSLIEAATAQVSDWAFYGCEFHDFVARDLGGSASLTSGIWLDEAYEIAFRDGNCSSGGAQYVRLSGAATGSSGIGVRNITFDKFTMYPDQGDTAPVLGIAMTTAPAGVTSPKKVVDVLNVINGCRIVLKDSTANAAVIYGVEGSEFIRPHLSQWDYHTTFTGYCFLIDGTGGTVTDPRIDAQDTKISFGSSGVVQGGQWLENCSTTQTAASISQGQWQIQMGGAVSLTAGSTVYYGRDGTANATEANVYEWVAPFACRIRNLRAYTVTAPGSGKTFTCTVRKGTPGTLTDTALIAVISDTNVTGTNSGDTFSMAAGDTLTIKAVALAGATTTARILFVLSGWTV